MTFIEFTEIAMLVLFGVSWPFNIIKSYRSRTAKGKSVLFELIVVVGYLFGLSGKFAALAQTGHMVKSIAELHSGDFGAENQKGGIEFFIAV